MNTMIAVGRGVKTPLFSVEVLCSVKYNETVFYFGKNYERRGKSDGKRK